MGTLRMFVPLILNLLGQLVLLRAGRTEFGVERSAAPGGFDDQNGLFQLFLHVDSEGELGADIAAILGGLISPCAKAGGQLAQALAIGTAIIRAGQIGHPDLVTYPWGSIGIAHFLEKGGRQRILADIVKGTDCGMALHVGLARQDEHLEWLGEGDRRQDAQQRCG